MEEEEEEEEAGEEEEEEEEEVGESKPFVLAVGCPPCVASEGCGCGGSILALLHRSSSQFRQFCSMRTYF